MRLDVAAAGGALALLASAAPLAAQWSPLASFSGPGAIGSPGGTHPLAVEGPIVHAVYQQGAQLFYRRSMDCGQTWSHPRQLTTQATAQYPCSLERCGAVLHLIWPDRRDGTWEVYTKRSPDGGDSWGPDVRLTHGVHLFRLGTAMSGETLHVVWGSNREVNPTPAGAHTWGEIYYKRSRDNGLTWEPDVRLTAPQGSAMRPAIAADGQYVHVTWFDRRDSKDVWDWEVYTKRSTDGGATWGPDVRMTNTPTHTRHPAIATCPGGVVCCIWEDGQVFDGKRWSGDAAIFAAVSTDNGKTWGPGRRITHINEPHSWGTHSKLYACGSRVFLAWTDSPEGTDKPHGAYFMMSADGGRTWGEPERLSAPGDDPAYAAAVAGTEDYAVVLINPDSGLFWRRRDLGVGR